MEQPIDFVITSENMERVFEQANERGEYCPLFNKISTTQIQTNNRKRITKSTCFNRFCEPETDHRCNFCSSLHRQVTCDFRADLSRHGIEISSNSNKMDEKSSGNFR